MTQEQLNNNVKGEPTKRNEITPEQRLDETMLRPGYNPPETPIRSSTPIRITLDNQINQE